MVTRGKPVIAGERGVDLGEALRLYDAVGWIAYTRDPAVLERALSGSHLVLTARVDGRLVGLARTVSDDATICYVQDLLVDPDLQRRGIGRALVHELLERYWHCRQLVLITDADSPAVHAFYRSVGLELGDEHGTSVFLRLC